MQQTDTHEGVCKYELPENPDTSRVTLYSLNTKIRYFICLTIVFYKLAYLGMFLLAVLAT
jgi:hypothetical protein